MHKINKLQGYIEQHREYSQHFIITLNEIYKNFESVIYLKLTRKATIPQ